MLCWGLHQALLASLVAAGPPAPPAPSLESPYHLLDVWAGARDVHLSHRVFAWRAVFPPLIAVAGQAPTRNVWAQQYKDRRAVDMAAQFENERRPVFRHRADIVSMLDLRPCMTVAEIGAGSGFLSRLASPAVGACGQVVSTELDRGMVAYMNDRAAVEGLTNVRAIVGLTDDTGLIPSSSDVVLVVNTYSFFDKPLEMMRAIAKAMKPGGLLVIVDFPPDGSEGVAPQWVIETATAVGLSLIDRRGAIPSHFALRFRRPARMP
jgi:SAM-dependent methyltransferase